MIGQMHLAVVDNSPKGYNVRISLENCNIEERGENLIVYSDLSEDELDKTINHLINLKKLAEYKNSWLRLSE